MIKNQYNRYPQSNEMRMLLGLPDKAKLPQDGMPEQTVQGVRIRVLPASQTVGRRSAGRHRVRALCPHCNKDVSAGRLPQHLKIHAEVSSC